MGRARQKARHSTPSFWSAFGDPASHHRRGRESGDWRVATTPIARRRPPSDVSICTGTLCREGCPAAPLCGVIRVAGATSRSTMACPARPGERCSPRAFNLMHWEGGDVSYRVQITVGRSFRACLRGGELWIDIARQSDGPADRRPDLHSVASLLVVPPRES